MVGFDDVTLLIGTCDKYSFLWPEFAEYFNKYWDIDIKINKYFVSETETADIPGFEFITPGKLSYSDCIKSALNNIDTKYVLWLQDDYFLQKTITAKEFKRLLDIAESYGLDRLGICEDSKYYTKHRVQDALYRLNQYSEYTVSMQASIWNRDFFRNALVSNESPWQFEVEGTRRVNKDKHNIYISIQSQPWYQEAMRKGKYTPWYLNKNTNDIKFS